MEKKFLSLHSFSLFANQVEHVHGQKVQFCHFLPIVFVVPTKLGEVQEDLNFLGWSEEGLPLCNTSKLLVVWVDD